MSTIQFTFPHPFQRRPNGAIQFAYHWQEVSDPPPPRYYVHRRGLGRIWAKPGESFWAAIARRRRHQAGNPAAFSARSVSHLSNRAGGAKA